MKKELAKTFIIPLIILAGIVAAFVLRFIHLSLPEALILIVISILGSYKMFFESSAALLKRQFALDYIAMLAVLVSLVTREYYVAALIALMISSGETLEDYGVMQAKKNLTNLIDRIPDEVSIYENGKVDGREKVENLTPGVLIFIKRGEVIPVDGELVSDFAQTDESSLTGEPYYIDKNKGDAMRSGTVNMGDAVVIKVTSSQENSAYNKIITLVQNAQQEKAPLVRLADKYSTIFTLITAGISLFAFIYSHYSWEAVLAVLVVATPCPLILATPIALMGGVNASAKKKIIIKKLANLEVLARANAFIFDKTGTITIGKPIISKVEVMKKGASKEFALAIAAALERNSLHPVAKAIVDHAHAEKVKTLFASNTKETVGKGISGKVEGALYRIEKEPSTEHMVVALFKGNEKIAEIYFEEEIKEESRKIVEKLKQAGILVKIFTGDKLSSAKKIAEKLGDIEIQAECSPEEKLKGIEELKKQKKVVAMVGDGINDAPALAMADVGIVFSNEEQTAASEAADVIFLHTSFSLVYESLHISRETIRIAMQSILAGIGVSILLMIIASFGFIPPVMGAFLQEAIDVSVIINALRASRIS